MAKHIRIFAPVAGKHDSTCLWPDELELPYEREVYGDGTPQEGDLRIQTVLGGYRGVVLEATTGGTWIHGQEVNGRLSATVFKFTVTQHGGDYSSFGLVNIRGEKRRAHMSYQLFTLPERQGWHGRELIRVHGFYLSTRGVGPRRKPQISDLADASSLVQVTPQMAVLRDVVLESSPRIMEAELALHCGVCHRMIERYTKVIVFVVPPVGAGLFYANPHRNLYSEAAPNNWAREQNAEMARVGDEAAVHPECIGLTLDW